MIVADSSYIIEALLKDSSMLDNYDMIFAPDFGFYEVLNAVWKYQILLKRIKDGWIILEIFFDLISAERIHFVGLEQETIKNAYELAVRTRMSVYDTAFIVLAKELKAELKTLDKKQAELFLEASQD